MGRLKHLVTHHPLLIAAFALAVAVTLVFAVRLITAPRSLWIGVEPRLTQRIYFANHTSNADFPLLWTALPQQLRRSTRPVAAEEYWTRSPLRRFIAQHVFNAVLIQRERVSRTRDPLDDMIAALDAGASLILFPEGTRNLTDAQLLPFKPGLYRLAQARPEIELVPVWIENLNRVMPKGEVIPIPLVCTVRFGSPVRLEHDQTAESFSDRARDKLLDLSSGGGDPS